MDIIICLVVIWVNDDKYERGFVFIKFIVKLLNKDQTKMKINRRNETSMQRKGRFRNNLINNKIILVKC